MSDLPLPVAFSPCPNDTYIFDALVHQRIDAEGLRIDPVLADVETLNRAAEQGQYPVTKLSMAAFGYLAGRYRLLDTGAALGRRCGPLVVVQGHAANDGLRSGARIAIPGLWTTANLLLGLYLERPARVLAMPYDQIMPSVADGRVDAGVIIHESRFTFAGHGLAAIVDLGQWWERQTGLPIPLGGIGVRDDVTPDQVNRMTRAIADSIRYARKNPAVSRPYIAAHAQELDDSVIDQHIDLYVNDFSIELGDTGRNAVRSLLDHGRAAGLLPEMSADLFATAIHPERVFSV